MALTLSKDYLTQLPANKTALIADQIYKSIVTEVFNAALSGRTSYTYDLVKSYINMNFYHPMYRMNEEKSISFTSADLPLIKSPLVISNEDLISNLQAKFPGCTVSYVGNETMPDYTDNNTLGQATHAAMQPGYVIPNGILIDWS